jgi:hypothetical protein
MKRPRPSEKSLQNLVAHRWKPGVSGNPAGRPIAVVSEVLRAISRQPVPLGIRLIVKRKLHIELPEGTTFGEAIGCALALRAICGDVYAIKEYLDRSEGRVTERVQVFDGRSVRIRVTYEPVKPGERKALAEGESELASRPELN